MTAKLALALRMGIVVTAILLRGAAAYSLGDVNPRALQGVWRLTSLDDEGLPFERKQRGGRGFFPPASTSSDPKTIWKLRGFVMKEFTTYPKKKMSEVSPEAVTPRKQTEIFIKLKDDFTFQQCTALQFSDGADEESSMEEELESELAKREKETFAWKGTWDFVDGKLILAADRPEKKPFSMYEDDDDASAGETGGDADTILIGNVAIQSGESLTDNPALEQRQALPDETTQASLPKKGTIDVHLSVPKGKIKMGKFMYPKDHPSFFEQPIVRPQSKGRFELKQILGETNAKLEDEEGELIELFRKKDLVGRRFYLSTFPLPKRRKKFERWDASENRYVKEEYEPTAEEKADEALTPGKNMQVMAVELFANNTFSTLGGLGTSTVLRGKWSIIGEKRDQLWMMVYRFGFGRSVSGSTFSEGTSLTQNDEKGYWGVIKEVGEDNIEGKIEIKGAVMVGWGLEPTTVGRFKMIEMEDMLEEEDEEEEEDDEEYVEMSEEDVLESANNFNTIMGSGGDADVEDDSSDPFDLPGAFE